MFTPARVVAIGSSRAAATAAAREALRAERGTPEFFDRGPGYERLARADVRGIAAAHRVQAARFLDS